MPLEHACLSPGDVLVTRDCEFALPVIGIDNNTITLNGSVFAVKFLKCFIGCEL